METAIFAILFILLLLVINTNSTKEHFDVSQVSASTWKDLATQQCAYLQNEASELKTMLGSCKTGQDLTLGQRNNINDKMSCVDNNNRLIFNQIESKAWCDSSNGITTTSLPMNPTNISYDNTTVIPDVFKNDDVKNYTNQPDLSIETNNLYMKIESNGFNGNNLNEKNYASW